MGTHLTAKEAYLDLSKWKYKVKIALANSNATVEVYTLKIDDNVYSTLLVQALSKAINKGLGRGKNNMARANAIIQSMYDGSYKP